MKNTMLNYSKTILGKVSFDPMLFKKELKKFNTILTDEEAKDLEEWCYSNYEIFFREKV